MKNCFSLEEDLKGLEWLRFKCRSCNNYAQNLYAALCNNSFSKLDSRFECSWRSSGRIVSEMVGSGSYLDWYCSGIEAPDVHRGPSYVQEGFLTSEIISDFSNIGWHPNNDTI